MFKVSILILTISSFLGCAYKEDNKTVPEKDFYIQRHVVEAYEEYNENQDENKICPKLKRYKYEHGAAHGKPLAPDAWDIANPKDIRACKLHSGLMDGMRFDGLECIKEGKASGTTLEYKTGGAHVHSKILTSENSITFPPFDKGVILVGWEGDPMSWLKKVTKSEVNNIRELTEPCFSEYK